MYLTDASTYLEVSFTFRGKAVTKHQEQLHYMPAERKLTPLEPLQQLGLTRQYLFPKQSYSAVLNKVHGYNMKRVNNSIRQAIR